MYYICSAKRCDWICVRFYSSNWRTSEFTYVIIDVHPTYILHTYVIIDVHPIYTRDYWRTPDIHTWLLTYIRYTCVIIDVHPIVFIYNKLSIIHSFDFAANLTWDKTVYLQHEAEVGDIFQDFKFWGLHLGQHVLLIQ